MKITALFKGLPKFLALGAFLSASLGSSAAFARPLKCDDLPGLFAAYLQSHYMYHHLTDEIKHHAVDQFVKNIDPSKNNLLQGDIDKLKNDVYGIFSSSTSSKAGGCVELDQAYDLLQTRVKENEDFVKKLLGPNFKLDESIEFVLDPQKREYPKTQAEKEQLLTKTVNFQISNYLLTGSTMAEAKRLLIKRYDLANKHLVDRKKDDALVAFADSFSLALDPHSNFLSQDSLEDFEIGMQLSLEGIGAALVSQDGYAVVEEVIPGGGADKSKMLRPKDKIIAVAQPGAKPESVVDMDLRDVVKKIRGKKGTIVRLTILRQTPKAETFDVAITRDKIDLKEQAAKISYQTRKVDGKDYKIGVIDLPSFYGDPQKGGRSTSGDVKQLLDQAKQQKVDGIVLNLSRNGGGLLEEAVKVSGLFIQNGGVVATKETDQKVDILADDDNQTEYSGPLVILTSRLSASASEIFAGALKDYSRAVIVGGDHTFGKGTVQTLARLKDNLGAMKVTIGMFFVPKGESTQHTGVPSDVVLPSIYSTPEIGETALDYSLQPQKIESFVSKDADSSDPAQHWKAIESSWVSKLREQSQKRITQEPKFSEIEKQISDSLKNKGVVKLAELRKEALDKKAKEKGKGKGKKAATGAVPPSDSAMGPDDEKTAEQEEKEAESPYIDEAVSVAVDLVKAES